MTHYRADRSSSVPSDLMSRTLHVGQRTALVAAAAVVTAASAQMSVTWPGSPIPFTLQPAAVLLAGAVLGARLGALSQALYLLMGVAGASAFAWSPVLLPGAARLLGPTGGFLLAFPLAAGVTGWLAERGWIGRPATALLAVGAGLAVLYVAGAAWLAALAPGTPAMVGVVALAPYAAADAVKASLVAVVAPSIRRALSRR